MQIKNFIEYAYLKTAALVSNWNASLFRRNSYETQSSTIKWIDWLMGADEDIHIVGLLWTRTVVPDKKVRCVRIRRKRCVRGQAVSSVAPLVRQSHALDFYLSQKNNRTFLVRFFVVLEVLFFNAKYIALPKLRNVIEKIKEPDKPALEV